MPEFRMKTEAWMTDASGRQKLYAAGETIELSNQQAQFVRLAGMIEPVVAPPAPSPAADAIEPSDEDARRRAGRGGRAQGSNADTRD